MPWSTQFDEAIYLRGGRRLKTLQHAADYIMTLPEDVQQQERWQIAVENLINAAEAGGGWLMFARIGGMRGLHGDEQGRERFSIPTPAPIAVPCIPAAGAGIAASPVLPEHHVQHQNSDQ